MATGQHERERQLQREISRLVESSVPGAEVLALEITGKERFCVYVDHPQGVDHALCGRINLLLQPQYDNYSIEVSSPGMERPLRTRSHFERAVGQTVRLKTEDLRFRGEIVAAGEQAVQIRKGSEPVDIPYDRIVRANLIDEGWGKG
jgi:ribosome maturation factor RimP